MRILIADDHPLNRKALGKTLQSLGHAVVEAEDGVQAMAILEGDPADVLISDVLMPNMDGYRLCFEIRHHPRLAALPVILSSSTYRSPDDRRLATEYGANAFLEKPATGESIAEILTTALANPPVTAAQAGPPENLRTLKQYSAQLVQRLQEKNEELELETRRLAESEEKFRQMAENIDQIFWMATGDASKVLYVSPAFEKIFGITREELLADPNSWTRSIHPDHVAAAEEDYRNGRHLTGTLDQEYRIVRPDGSERWIHSRSFPIRNAAGEVYRITGIASDVTARRDLERKLLGSQKLEAVGRLAGGVAHDFNNNLSVILGYAELLIGGLRPGEPRSVELDEILKAGKRAAGLTRQLLAFSRQQVMELRLLNLDDVVDGIEKMLRRVLGEDIILHVRKAADLRPVMADQGQIEQVLMNLAVNARDAMPQGGELTIQTGNVDMDGESAAGHELAPGPYTMLAVIDTGIGMDRKTLGRLFEPFFTTKEIGKGSGLGLATVFGIVKQTHGGIRVTSDPGKGSVFRVYLPSAAGTALPATAVASPPARKGVETILLVEDDESVKCLAAKILNRYGYRILQARDPEEALLLGAKTTEPIHLLLTDVVMPRMSGPELGKQLAAILPGLKILCMSGYTDEAVLRHGLSGSGLAFLQKPITSESLSRKVREVLDSMPGENEGRFAFSPVPAHGPDDDVLEVTPALRNATP